MVPGRRGRAPVVNGVARSHKNALVRNLDDPGVLAAAREDPVGFVDHPGLLIIDEIQRAPELFLPIKYRVDSDPTPGRFLLSGSARVLGLKTLPDALPGRMETIELWPFSQGELSEEDNRDKGDSFIDAVFQLADMPLPQLSAVPRQELAIRITRGCFPEAVARSVPRRRNRFFNGYVQTLIDRDIRQLLAAERLATDLSISGRTAMRYLELCEEIFLIKRIPALSSNLGKRAVSTPKVACVDSGVAAYLIRQDENRLSALVDSALGPLLEGFVLMELSRQIT